MSKFAGRVNRLIKQTHRFVPIEAYRTIAESFRLLLEAAEKRPHRERRVANLDRLFKAANRSKDEAIDAQIRHFRATDEEAWFAYFVPFWESKADRKILGDWQPKESAMHILEVARRAEADLEWRKKKPSKEERVKVTGEDGN